VSTATVVLVVVVFVLVDLLVCRYGADGRTGAAGPPDDWPGRPYRPPT
jgi:hypothetical protein